MSRWTTLVAAGVIGMFAAACGDDDESPAAAASAAELVACEFTGHPDSQPGPENEVQVAGGASCDEAAALFGIGPGLADLKPHQAADVAIKPEIEGDWTCEAEQPGGPNSTLDVSCSDGVKRVEYLFH